MVGNLSTTKILINDGRMDRPEDQAEAVTTNSFLVCQHGGVIEFRTDGQEIRSDTGSQGGAVAGATAALGVTAKSKQTPAKGKDNTARRTAIKTPEFTLQIYHISNYNYLLNVILIEGDHVTILRTDIFSPERKFVLTENDSFFYG